MSPVALFDGDCPVVHVASEQDDMTPTIVWTVHALERLAERGLTRDVVEQAVRELHAVREQNDGEADWRIDASRFFVLYDHPDGSDTHKLRIITAWSEHRKYKRRLRAIGDGGKKGYSDR